jgi:hypothetical protein
MEGKIRHLGIIKNGNFKPYKPELFENNLQQYEGKPVYIVFQEYLPDKTQDQLGYYYGGIITGTCMQTEIFGGWTKEEIDNFFQSMFLQETVYKEVAGEVRDFTIRRRISSLSKKDLSVYIQQVIQWLSLEDIIVLDSELYIAKKYKPVKNNVIKENKG